MQDILDQEMVNIDKEKFTNIDQISTDYALDSGKCDSAEWKYMFRLRIQQKKLTLIARNSEELFLWLVSLNKLLSIKIEVQTYTPP